MGRGSGAVVAWRSLGRWPTLMAPPILTLQGESGKMSASDLNSAIFVSDTPKQVGGQGGPILGPSSGCVMLASWQLGIVLVVFSGRGAVGCWLMHIALRSLAAAGREAMLRCKAKRAVAPRSAGGGRRSPAAGWSAPAACLSMAVQLETRRKSGTPSSSVDCPPCCVPTARKGKVSKCASSSIDCPPPCWVPPPWSDQGQGEQVCLQRRRRNCRGAQGQG